MRASRQQRPQLTTTRRSSCGGVSYLLTTCFEPPTPCPWSCRTGRRSGRLGHERLTIVPDLTSVLALASPPWSPARGVLFCTVALYTGDISDKLKSSVLLRYFVAGLVVLRFLVLGEVGSSSLLRPLPPSTLLQIKNEWFRLSLMDRGSGLGWLHWVCLPVICRVFVVLCHLLCVVHCVCVSVYVTSLGCVGVVVLCLCTCGSSDRVLALRDVWSVLLCNPWLVGTSALGVPVAGRHGPSVVVAAIGRVDPVVIVVAQW